MLNRSDVTQTARDQPPPWVSIQRVTPPFIGEVQTIKSSTTSNSNSTGASTRLYRQERHDSEQYWNNITEIMYEYFNDDHQITN
eukprot:6203833-Amphidinium_carterae.1